MCRPPCASNTNTCPSPYPATRLIARQRRCCVHALENYPSPRESAAPAQQRVSLRPPGTAERPPQCGTGFTGITGIAGSLNFWSRYNLWNRWGRRNRLSHRSATLVRAGGGGGDTPPKCKVGHCGDTPPLTPDPLTASAPPTQRRPNRGACSPWGGGAATRCRGTWASCDTLGPSTARPLLRCALRNRP